MPLDQLCIGAEQPGRVKSTMRGSVQGSLNRDCLPRKRYVILTRTMISDDTLTAYIRQAMPDATVKVVDKTGTRDHLIVLVTSDLFRDKNLLDRHRTVYEALAVPMRDGRIHALEITAKTTDET